MREYSYEVWDFTALSPHQLDIILEALQATDFNFGKLIPGLVAQKHKNKIPVEFIDLSRWAQKLEESAAAGGHDHVHEGNDIGHPITRIFEGRRRVLGLAWYSGKVSIEITLEHDRELAQEVFLAEGAHMVDFFYMTPEHREQIFDIYHGDDHSAHDHGWFEETGNDNYWSWVGESFMYGFIAAFSTIQGTGDAFIHQTTPEIGKRIRRVFEPEYVAVRRKGSSIIHRLGGWHELQIKDYHEVDRFETIEDAELDGYRKCKTCNWRGAR